MGSSQIGAHQAAYLDMKLHTRYLRCMLNSPFDSSVGFAAVNSTASNQYVLQPEEEAYLSKNASPERRVEYYLGRAAANQALKSLNIENPGPVLKGEYGEPLWPDGIVGSISHTGRFAIAAVAFRENYRGIGIDCENLRRKFSLKILTRIAHPEEADWVMKRQSNLRALMLFSAKECIFKTFFPENKHYIGFKDAKLSWDSYNRQFIGDVRLKGSKGKVPVSIQTDKYEDYSFTYLAIKA